MKKVTVLCLDTHRDAALEYLRELGILHIEPVRLSEGPAVETARRDVEYIRLAMEILPAHSRQLPSGRSPITVVHDLWKVIHERTALQDEREGLIHEIARLEPFGDVDPSILRALTAVGVEVRLYQASPKAVPATPPGAVRVDCGSDKQAVRFAIVSRGPAPVPEALEIRPPERRLSDLRARLEKMAERERELQEQTVAFGGDYAGVAALREQAEDVLALAEARAGMGAAVGDRIVYIRGYCPADQAPCFHEAARESGWGVVTEDPAEDDPVPTFIRTPRWARPIESLMDFIGILPGYREIDISVVFLLFFGLFFAMLVGDAGYGVLFLAASLWFRRKNKTAPRKIFTLIEMMSAATVVWGVLTGNYFGIVARGFLARGAVAWLQQPENIQALCFKIAVIHLSLAHAWNLWRSRKSLQALAQLGWLGSTWTMYFLANMMVLGRPFPPALWPVFAASVGLIVLFMTPVRALKAEWFNHVMLPLNLVSNFVDVVSYIRLYAVGTASAAVAASFNGMLAPMFGHWAGGLVAAVFLFLAHALNVVLSLMGVMVHGVRLNTLEFSGHIGLQWTGIPFAPFRRSGPPAENA